MTSSKFHVFCTGGPTAGQHFLMRFYQEQMLYAKDSVNESESGHSWKSCAMEGRIIFGEIVEELGISSCWVSGHCFAFSFNEHSFSVFLLFDASNLNDTFAIVKIQDSRECFLLH